MPEKGTGRGLGHEVNRLLGDPRGMGGSQPWAPVGGQHMRAETPRYNWPLVQVGVFKKIYDHHLNKNYILHIYRTMCN